MDIQERARLRLLFIEVGIVVTADKLAKSVLAEITDCHDSRLSELGFLPGEKIMIINQQPFNGVRAVRVGTGTFALRPEELACILIKPI